MMILIIYFVISLIVYALSLKYKNKINNILNFEDADYHHTCLFTSLLFIIFIPTFIIIIPFYLIYKYFNN